MLLLPLTLPSLTTFDCHDNSIPLQQIYIYKLNYCFSYKIWLGSSKSKWTERSFNLCVVIGTKIQANNFIIVCVLMKTASVSEQWKSGRPPSGERFGHVLSVKWASTLKEAHSAMDCRCSPAQSCDVQWQLIHKVARDSPRANAWSGWPQHQEQGPDCQKTRESRHASPKLPLDWCLECISDDVVFIYSLS